MKTFERVPESPGQELRAPLSAGKGGMPLVYRVQDKEGRGPYRPGFSHVWTEWFEGRDSKPTFMEEFGEDLLKRAPEGWHFGCAFHSLEQCQAWFSPTEMKRLDSLGYRLVRMRVNAILGASQHQLVIGRKTPLRCAVEVIDWPSDGAGNPRPTGLPGTNTIGAAA